MEQSSSESSIDKNKFPSVINLYALNCARHSSVHEFENVNTNFEMKSLFNYKDDLLLEIDKRNSRTTDIKKRGSFSFVDSQIDNSKHHSDTESESSIDQSDQDKISTTSTSTSSDDGQLHKQKSESDTKTYHQKNHQEYHSIKRNEITDDVISLKTHPNCPSSPSMWSSSTSGKLGNLFSKHVKIRGSMSQDVSQYRHSIIGNRLLTGALPHGYRLNSQAADSGISNTSPDTLSSTEFYQRNLDDCHRLAQCHRLISNSLPLTSNLPTHSILKHRRRHLPGVESSVLSLKSLISNLVYVMYISLLSIIVLVFSIAEQRRIPGSNIVLEGIQIFLYSISILFMVMFNLSDCKGRTRKLTLSKLSMLHNQNMDLEHCLILSNPSSFETQDISNLGNNGDNIATARTSDLIIHMSSSKMKLLSESSRDMFEGLFKISILIFGIISIVRDCFELAAVIETGQLNMVRNTHCTSMLAITRTFLSLLCSFIQIYFLFLDSSMILMRINQRIVFGIVHLTATNFTSLLHNIISSKMLIRDPKTPSHLHTSTSIQHNLPIITVTRAYSNLNRTSCLDSDWIRQIMTISEKYLYPFSFQYNGLSIVLYLVLLWSFDSANYNKNYDNENLNLASNSIKQATNHNNALRTVHCRVNCRNSNRGFFIGLFSLLLSIVSILLLNIFSKNASLQVIGMDISYCSEMLLTNATTFVLVGTLYQIRYLSLIIYKKSQNKIEVANRVIILFSLFGGIYLYNISCIISWSNNTDVHSAPFVMISSICTIVNGTVQTIFILLSLAKNCSYDSQSICKPNKGYIAFVLMNNIALWCLTLFVELQQHSVNNIPNVIFMSNGWILIKRISIPLTLMFRVDSVISLAVIWRLI